MQHAYIKPTSSNLNGKVERSHLTDNQEFYQFIEYTGDVDLRENLITGKHSTTSTDHMKP